MPVGTVCPPSSGGVGTHIDPDGTARRRQPDSQARGQCFLLHYKLSENCVRSQASIEVVSRLLRCVDRHSMCKLMFGNTASMVTVFMSHDLPFSVFRSAFLYRLLMW